MVVEIMKIKKIKLPIYHGTLIVIKTNKMSKSAAKYLIGMSVPPIMTAQISTQIYSQWLSKL
jgi:hypothetical protein